MSDVPKALSPEWFLYYESRIAALGNEMALPDDVIRKAQMLWSATMGRVSRSPLPLAVDCLYICAKLSGNRVSIKATKRATKKLWKRTIEVLPPNRRGGLRWVWDYKVLITAPGFYPDEEAWYDLVGAWRGRVVDPTYFDEEEVEGEEE